MKKYIINKTREMLRFVVYMLLPLAGGGWLGVSCSDFFETESNRQIFDPALDQKTDSMFYTLGILRGVQQVADQYVMTGEMRGDLVATNTYTETALRQLANFTADQTNKYDSAYLYYRIINNCNYYIAHRDTSLRTGSRMVAIPEYAEALAVRAWAYLQLCKTYGEVPFYTDPLTSIGDANRQMEKKDLKAICDELAPKLIEFSGTPVPTYGNIEAGTLNSSESDNAVTKTVVSRRIMIPIDVVLGDLFLETHQYELAAQYYFKFLSVNKWQIREAYINPMTSYIYSNIKEEMPNALMSSNYNEYEYQWSSIFSVTGTNDIVTYIPLAPNRLRGITTELPRYFGYDFYSTTSSSNDQNGRYILERQIDPSSSYIALSNAQTYYYSTTTNTGLVVRSAAIGDLRRYVTMRQVAKEDSSFAVMTKYIGANVPLYRTATVYLRLAEALNRMGYPDAAFAILKDGINDNLASYVMRYDGQDKETGRYIRPETITMLQTTVPFLSDENIESFTDNWGIHSRGTFYTRGAFSPYQMDTIVTQKIAELKEVYNITPTGTMQDTINAMEDIICDEMALELAYEGCRFNDLTRIALHKNRSAEYGPDFGTRWLAKKLGYKAAGLEQRLLDEKNWYLPM
jgi:hypothetical protein